MNTKYLSYNWLHHISAHDYAMSILLSTLSALKVTQIQWILSDGSTCPTCSINQHSMDYRPIQFVASTNIQLPICLIHPMSIHWSISLSDLLHQSIFNWLSTWYIQWIFIDPPAYLICCINQYSINYPPDTSNEYSLIHWPIQFVASTNIQLTICLIHPVDIRWSISLSNLLH